MSAQWFCARAKPGQDQIAVENLKRQDFEVYYPLEMIEREWKGRVIKTLVPIFYSYVLVNTILTPSAWRAINATRGVYRLISFRDDGRPSPANTSEVERLQARERAGEFRKSFTKRHIRKNDLVRLKTGIDTTSIGRVVRTRSERIEFLLNCFGRQTCVVAPAHRLEIVGHLGSQ